MRLIVLWKEECFMIEGEWKGDFPQNPLEQFHFNLTSITVDEKFLELKNTSLIE